ncbi:MAG: glycerophosphodiester phosphodiesterase family protein, partial [Bacteroidales bacterium]|nr:glycerophosphodiester phosphodiesterase family protein [Bacteroidales bacterium]
AHRGDWRNWPENSLPGFESAIEMGVDIIELDVHMTKDSVLVVCHDGTLDRTTSGKGRIIDHTLAEIKALHLRKGHGVIDDVNKVPTLEEALKLCKDRVVVNVDKGWNYYDQVLAISEKLGVTGQILIKGSASVEEVDKIMSAHDHNMMYMPVTNFDSKKGKALYAEYQSGNICPLAFEICWSKMRPDVASACSEVEEGHESKLWINSLWPSLNGGLDDDTAMKDPDAVYGKILKMGATIIQSDRPAFLISYLHKHHRHYSNR